MENNKQREYVLSEEAIENIKRQKEEMLEFRGYERAKKEERKARKLRSGFAIAIVVSTIMGVTVGGKLANWFNKNKVDEALNDIKKETITEKQPIVEEAVELKGLVIENSIEEIQSEKADLFDVNDADAVAKIAVDTAKYWSENGIDTYSAFDIANLILALNQKDVKFDGDAYGNTVFGLSEDMAYTESQAFSSFLNGSTDILSKQSHIRSNFAPKFSKIGDHEPLAHYEMLSNTVFDKVEAMYNSNIKATEIKEATGTDVKKLFEFVVEFIIENHGVEINEKTYKQGNMTPEAQTIMMTQIIRDLGILPAYAKDYLNPESVSVINNWLRVAVNNTTTIGYSGSLQYPNYTHTFKCPENSEEHTYSHWSFDSGDYSIDQKNSLVKQYNAGVKLADFEMAVARESIERAQQGLDYEAQLTNFANVEFLGGGVLSTIEIKNSLIQQSLGNAYYNSYKELDANDIALQQKVHTLVKSMK